VFIARDQFNACFVDDPSHKTFERARISIADHLTDHVSFARNCSDDGSTYLAVL
jgi:hypothetical protein